MPQLEQWPKYMSKIKSISMRHLHFHLLNIKCSSLPQINSQLMKALFNSICLKIRMEERLFPSTPSLSNHFIFFQSTLYHSIFQLAFVTEHSTTERFIKITLMVCLKQIKVGTKNSCWHFIMVFYCSATHTPLASTRHNSLDENRSICPAFYKMLLLHCMYTNSCHLKTFDRCLSWSSSSGFKDEMHKFAFSAVSAITFT